MATGNIKTIKMFISSWELRGWRLPRPQDGKADLGRRGRILKSLPLQLDSTNYTTLSIKLSHDVSGHAVSI